MDEFTKSYIETALWLTTDENGEYLDDKYTVEDIDPDAMKDILEDCKDFQEANADLIAGDFARAGYDFFLTRNRHGAGFWDGGWPDEVGKRLTEMSHPYGTFGLYVGDDGKLYHHN